MEGRFAKMAAKSNMDDKTSNSPQNSKAASGGSNGGQDGGTVRDKQHQRTSPASKDYGHKSLEVFKDHLPESSAIIHRQKNLLSTFWHNVGVAKLCSS